MVTIVTYESKHSRHAPLLYYTPDDREDLIMVGKHDARISLGLEVEMVACVAPASCTYQGSMTEQIKEVKWRLNCASQNVNYCLVGAID